MRNAIRTCARHWSSESPRRPVETTSTALMLRSVFRASASACWTASSELVPELPTSSMIFTTAISLPFPRMLRCAWSVDDPRPLTRRAPLDDALRAAASRSRAARGARSARGVSPARPAGADRGLQGGLALRRRHRPRETRRTRRAVARGRPPLPRRRRPGHAARRRSPPGPQAAGRIRRPPLRASSRGAGARDPVYRRPDGRQVHAGAGRPLEHDRAGDVELHARRALARARLLLDQLPPLPRPGGSEDPRLPLREDHENRPLPGDL